MKKLLIAVALFASVAAYAAPVTLIGSLVNVNNATSNSAPTTITYNPALSQFNIQNGGLTATNALVVNIQISIDQTNYVTIATYRPSATNATTETFYPGSTPVTVYMRAQAVTTNSVNLGGTYGY